ncbi:MAG: hypothetical protein IAG13_01545, partial [Deltaproteobacteria bacterium]|nr:hypothetical protein [Nannocystaceae bacterium]
IFEHVDVSWFFHDGHAYLLASALTLAVILGFARLPGVGRVAYAVALVLFHLMYVTRYSLGEISHGSHFIGMAVLGLAIADLAMPSQMRERFTLGFLFFFYGIAYTSAGFCKLIGSGLGWADGRHLALWLGERTVDIGSTFGSFEPNALQRVLVAHPALATAVLAFGLLAELGGVALWLRRTRPYAATALIAMHVGVELSLGIWFGHNIYALLAIAYPWGPAIDRALVAFDRSGLAAASRSSSDRPASLGH